MNRAETIRVMVQLKSAFPKYYSDINDEALNGIVALWTEMLKEYPYINVLLATQAVIATSKFHPTIADIIEKLKLLNRKVELTEMEAWGVLRGAICNSLYNSDSEYNNLPKEIRCCVTPELLKVWAELDIEEVETVIQSNFMRTFNSKAKVSREYLQLPENLQSQISILANKLTLN